MNRKLAVKISNFIQRAALSSSVFILITVQWSHADSGHSEALPLGSDDWSDFTPPECVDNRANENQLIKDATSSKSFFSFLESKGVQNLRLYTFVTKSDNLDFSGAISLNTDAAEFGPGPGPIRMSLDGRIAMRWSCDRSSSSFGKVDIFVKTGLAKPKYRTYVFNFRIPGPHKPDTDTSKCIGCHSSEKSPSFHPIFTQYPNWPTMLGGVEDFVPATTLAPRGNLSERDFKIAFQQRSALEQLRERAKKDPCYGSLPGLKSGGDIPGGSFPYAASDRSNAYRNRPNLAATMAFSYNYIEQSTKRASADSSLRGVSRASYYLNLMRRLEYPNFDSWKKKTNQSETSHQSESGKEVLKLFLNDRCPGGNVATQAELLAKNLGVPEDKLQDPDNPWESLNLGLADRVNTLERQALTNIPLKDNDLPLSSAGSEPPSTLKFNDGTFSHAYTSLRIELQKAALKNSPFPRTAHPPGKVQDTYTPSTNSNACIERNPSSPTAPILTTADLEGDPNFCRKLEGLLRSANEALSRSGPVNPVGESTASEPSY